MFKFDYTVKRNLVCKSGPTCDINYNLKLNIALIFENVEMPIFLCGKYVSIKIEDLDSIEILTMLPNDKLYGTETKKLLNGEIDLNFDNLEQTIVIVNDITTILNDFKDEWMNNNNVIDKNFFFWESFHLHNFINNQIMYDDYIWELYNSQNKDKSFHVRYTNDKTRGIVSTDISKLKLKSYLTTHNSLNNLKGVNIILKLNNNLNLRYSEGIKNLIFPLELYNDGLAHKEILLTSKTVVID